MYLDKFFFLIDVKKVTKTKAVIKDVSINVKIVGKFKCINSENNSSRINLYSEKILKFRSNHICLN